VPRPRRSRRRTWLTLAILVLISVSVITLDQRVSTHHLTSGIKSVANDVFSPIRRGVDAVIQPIGNFFAGMVGYGSLQQENAKLRATIGELRQNAAEQSFAQQQLAQLSRLQHLSYLGTIPTLNAQVQSYNASNFEASVQINKGRSDGILVGMPVIGNGGLVGQVTEASHHTATVTLLTDGQSKVGVTFGPSNDTYWANVQGQGAGTALKAAYVQPGTPVQDGEIMYTNQAQGGAYPSGIPVAHVVSSHTVSGAAQISITLSPQADLAHLTYVAVVLWAPAP
jgi:rod shape-determining protein MreC